jgi:MYXO-CTERM domain-containing protein
VPGCRGTGGNGCPTGQACTSTTSAIGTCPPAEDGGAIDAPTDGNVGPTDAADAAGTGGNGGAGTTGAGGSSGGAGTSGDDGGQDGGQDSGTDGPALGPDGYLAGGGCHCNTNGGRGAPTGAVPLLLLAFIAARRRRRP